MKTVYEKIHVADLREFAHGRSLRHLIADQLRLFRHARDFPVLILSVLMRAWLICSFASIGLTLEVPCTHSAHGPGDGTGLIRLLFPSSQLGEP